MAATMGISLAVVGIAHHFIAQNGHVPASAAPSGVGIVTLIALVAFIISFAFSMGPVTWTVISEIFPGRIRGGAVAVCTAMNWGSAFLVSQFFLSLVEAIGSASTYWLFALFCVIGWIWIYYWVLETKGRSLEQVRQIWMELRK